MNRRVFLRRVTPVAAVGLAGCSGSGDGDGGDGEGGPTTTATETAASPTTSAAATSTATAPPPEETETTAPTASTTADMEPQGSITVLVGPGGNLRFDPEFFVLREGGTVTWQWESSGHNVRPSQKPEGVNWAGSPQPPRRTFDAGYTYEW